MALLEAAHLVGARPRDCALQRALGQEKRPRRCFGCLCFFLRFFFFGVFQVPYANKHQQNARQPIKKNAVIDMDFFKRLFVCFDVLVFFCSPKNAINKSRENRHWIVFEGTPTLDMDLL
jgi:hypothetical protein